MKIIIIIVIIIMYGQFTKNTDGIDWEKSWSWLRNGDLKGCTEALVCSAQEQALRTNYTKHYIDKTNDTPLCRMCSDKGETVSHLASECAKLAQTEYKRRHDNVARYIHWLLAEKCGFERATKWYEQKPEGVLENCKIKLLWDFMIQCDRVVEARRPDIVVVDKEKKDVKIIDIAIPGDNRVKGKEQEKIEKYQPLKEQIGKLWNMEKVTVIPGPLGCISYCFEEHMEKIGIDVKLQVIQKTALLGTARILRQTLSM